MENTSTTNPVATMQNPYDLGSMSREEVVQLFEKLGVFQAGLTMLSYMYNAQSALSISMYADMNEASKASTTAQKMANLVDAKIADVQSSSDKNAKAKLPQEVIDYLNDPRNGVNIDTSALTPPKSSSSDEKALMKEINDMVEQHVWEMRGMVKFRLFDENKPLAEQEEKIKIITDGIIPDDPFLAGMVGEKTLTSFDPKIKNMLEDYLKKSDGNNQSPSISMSMGSGDLQTVKAAISAKANNLTTIVNNSQLSIQQMSNTLNLLTSARSDMQSLQYRTISAISFGK